MTKWLILERTGWPGKICIGYLFRTIQCRLYDQEGMAAMAGGSRPNPFCACAIVGLRTKIYLVTCDINDNF